MRQNYFTKPMHTRLLAVAFLIAAFTASAVTATNTAAAKGTNAPGQAPIVIANSEFTIPTTIGAGRDPFFPSRAVTKKVASSTNDTSEPATLNLILQGISGTKARRFALINGRTFGTGEEAEITAGKGKVRVTCVSIGEDSCIVEYNGKQQLLKLRPGL